MHAEPHEAIALKQSHRHRTVAHAAHAPVNKNANSSPEIHRVEIIQIGSANSSAGLFFLYNQPQLARGKHIRVITGYVLLQLPARKRSRGTPHIPQPRIILPKIQTVKVSRLESPQYNTVVAK